MSEDDMITEFRKRMEQCLTITDQERAHIEADKLLCDIILELGDRLASEWIITNEDDIELARIVQLFANMRRWYS